MHRDSPAGRSCLPPPRGLLFVLSGPSGVGKDAVIQRLKEQQIGLHFAVTVTTRAERPGEVHGVNYYFATAEDFNRMRERDELLEWAVVHGNNYGTPVGPIRQALDRGEDVLLKIDVQGAAQVKQRVPDAIFLFLAPTSIEQLVQRLNHRGTESPEEQERRTRDACEEMKRLSDYDYVVVNYEEKLDQAVKYLKSVIVGERCRVHPRRIRL